MVQYFGLQRVFFCFSLSWFFTPRPATSTPLVDPWIVHEQRQSLPSAISFQGAAEPTEWLMLHIALIPNNIQGLEAALYAVSDPNSARYGQHLTKQEVRMPAIM